MSQVKDFKLKGLSTILQNLNKEIKKIEGRSLQGLIQAAVKVRYDMGHTPPLVPWDTGNLNASWFIATSKGTVETPTPTFKDDEKMGAEHASITHYYASSIAGTDPKVVMGFTARYALPVHEMIQGEFQKEGAGAKFFEAALTRNRKEILSIIKKKVQIK